MATPARSPSPQLNTVFDLLVQNYGLPLWRRRGDPTEQLVMTILSQHTSDINSDRAFRSLQAAFPHWQAVIEAPTPAVVTAIRSGGLANQKAPRIQQALRQIWQQNGSFDLNHLATWPVAEARAWLMQLPGVGAKTASIVLLFSLQRPAFAVDTHVHRLSRRLGLAPAGATPARVMHTIEQLAPADWLYPLHLNLIRHGRAVCKARRPHCDTCFLQRHCPFYQSNNDDPSTHPSHS